MATPAARNLLELKISFDFIPKIYCSPEDVEAVLQKARFYDFWTFARLVNDLLKSYDRNAAPAPEGRARNAAHISLISQGFSGSSVFGVEFVEVTTESPIDAADARLQFTCRSWADVAPSGEAFILKIGPHEELAQERQNYMLHVNGILSAQLYPRLLAYTTFIDRTAAILYERLTDIVSFLEFYNATTNSEAIVKRLSLLFTELKVSWYDRGAPHRRNLFDAYHLTDRGDRFLEAVRHLASPEEIRRQRIDILGPGNIAIAQGRNPFDLLQHPHFADLTVLESPVHDDLNPYNILVHPTNPDVVKLIDFASSRVRPTLQDFAKFEMSILFLLYDRARNSEPWCVRSEIRACRAEPVFQSWILLAKSLIDDLVSDPNTASVLPVAPEDLKLVQTVRSIRSFARQFYYIDWPLEYSIALFCWALRATYWNDASPAKRVFAYLVSSLLAEKIAQRHREMSTH
jgi:uncharacterized protein associated with vWA-MoxR-VMAP ternary system